MSHDRCEYCGQEERYGHNAICVMNTVAELRADIEQMRVALKYGRDCVMESFEHVKNSDDQVMADARLQAIDAALNATNSAECG